MPQFKVMFRLFLALVIMLALRVGNSAHAQSIQITSPNGGECLTVYTARTVTWSMSGIHHANLYYSLTGNEPDSVSLVQAIAGQTAYTWIVPPADSGTVKIFIKGLNASNAILATDETDSNFSIRVSCAANTAPFISNVRSESIGTASAQIRWDTDEVSDSRVSFGTTPGSYPQTSTSRCDAGGNVTSHCVNLSSLAEGTNYYYQAGSADPESLLAQSSEYSFTSLAGSNSSHGMVPNAVSAFTSSYVASTPSGASIDLAWTDNAVNELELKLYERLRGSEWPVSPTRTLTAGTTSERLPAPSSSGTYEYRVDACNVLGCAQSGIAMIVMGAETFIVRGIVTLADAGVQAFVSARSDKGGFAETVSEPDGTYTLALQQNAAWVISANRIESNTLYRSHETALTPSSGTAELDLFLLPVNTSLPDPISATIDPLVSNSIASEDGFRLDIPAGAIGSADLVTLTIEPDANFTNTVQASVVGIAYDVTLTGKDGVPISTLNSPMTLSIPYADADVAAFGVSPEELSLAFWDVQNTAWEGLAPTAVDYDMNIISGTVAHLTRFALVAPADTQPPDPPYGIKVAVSAGGIAISWSNPNFDFHHAKLYRSTVKNVTGMLLKNDLTVAAYTDTVSRETGITYYYTVRAVDLAGNESANTVQYTTAGPAGIPSPKELGPQLVPTFIAKGGSVTSTAAMVKDAEQIPAYQKYPNGTMLRIIGEQNIWIVMNGYRRLLAPQVLGVYEHLKNAPVIYVSKKELDRYKLAAWVRYVKDPKVYEVNDDATRHWLDMTANDFTETGRRWEAVFVINKEELMLYADGPNVVRMK